MLEIKHLTKAYERVILKDVCLSFKEKGLYVITGQSGCGKSTLLNMIVKTQRFCHHKIQQKCHHDFSFLTFSIIMLYEGGFYIGQKRSY